MEVFLSIVASLAFLMAVLLFITPRTLLRASEVMNREVEADDFVFSRRMIFGGLLIVLGGLMLYFLIWG